MKNLSQQELRAIFGYGSVGERAAGRGRLRRATPGRVMVGGAALLLTVAAIVFAGVPRNTPVVILSYNVQNLFDGVDTGSEYPEFRSSSGYGEKRYWNRLERLAETIAGAAHGLPDVIFLSELENSGVAEELSRSFLRGGYQITSGSDDRTTTKVVFLTRVLPTSVSVHAAAVLATVPDSSPRLHWRSRDALFVTLPGSGYRVYGAHWKSQSGGERQTEALRLMEARLARSVALEARAGATPLPVLLIGDLNEDLHEYNSHGGAYPTALQSTGTISPEDPASGIVFTLNHELQSSGVWWSLWATASEAGSYAYQQRWERLDHAFLLSDGSPQAQASKLRVHQDSALRDGDGFPARYDPRTGTGVSDHLPLVIELSRYRAQ